MSNVQPSLGKDRDQVVSLHDLSCINGRSQNEHLYDLNEWPEEQVAALIKEQCLGNNIRYYYFNNNIIL